MSGGKNGGVPHRVFDELAKFEAKWNGKQNELIKKHNEMGANMAAIEQMVKQMAGFMASEMGKFQGTVAQHIGTLGRTTSGLDLNVLALAEISKEVFGQLTQIDALLKKIHSATGKLITGPVTTEALEEFNKVLDLTEEEVKDVKADAEEWYKSILQSSFQAAQERIMAAEKEALAQQKADEEAAKAAAEKAEAATEKETVEAELKKAAEAEKTVVANVSGGPGAAFPEGADIFGG